MRSPIIVTLAHVDHGKTTLLDYIRNTAIAQKEAGGITQSIGSTFVPKEVIEKKCGYLLKQFHVDVQIPGLLWIDTPGHAAFTTMRQRGGKIADIAVLLIDINEGVKPQTEESIHILKVSKTPFVVGMNKIDKIFGWKSENEYFLKNLSNQSPEAISELEKKFYQITEKLSEQGVKVERFDRIKDFTKQIAGIPISAKTGEGVPELLVILTGLSQQYLKTRLETTGKSKGVVLEVKEVRGLGTTIDTIIYDGYLKKNDYIIIEGDPPIVSKIKALFIPNPLKDMRAEKQFRSIEECHAAAGVKIVASSLENVIAGSEFRTTSLKDEIELLKEELIREKKLVEVENEQDGLILKAGTIGGLEALLNIFDRYPVRRASVGLITKRDIIDAATNKNEFNKIVLGFDIVPSDEAKQFAKDHGISIITSDVIYKVLEEYEKWVKKKKENIKQKELKTIARAGKIKILSGCVFRTSNPAIVGCEVLAGLIKPGSKLLKISDGIKHIGEIKQIQIQGENVEEVKTGERAAISIQGPIVGRQIKEGDELYTDITKEDYEKMLKFSDLVSKSELEAAEEIKKIKKF